MTGEKDKEKNEAREYKREELRGLFLLGLLAVFVAIRYQNGSMIMKFQLIEFSLVPVIDVTVALWVLYALFMVFGLSDDVIGKTLSSMFKELSKIFLALDFLILTAIGILLFIFEFPDRYHWIFELFAFAFTCILISKSRQKKKSNLSIKDFFTKINLLKIIRIGTMIVLVLSVFDLLYYPDANCLLGFFILGCIAFLGLLLTEKNYLRKVDEKK